MTTGKRYGVRRDGDNWLVYDLETGEIMLDGVTNSRAWCEVDRLLMEPTSRREAVSDWVWNKP